MKRIYIFYVIFLMIAISACRTVEYAPEYVRIGHVYDSLEANTVDSCLTPFISEADSLTPPGKELMQIMVVRHGKPKLEISKLYSWRKAQEYMQAYDTVGVEEFVFNPICLTEDLENVYCSVLERSRHTAEYMCGGDYVVVEDLKFREFERQVPHIPLLRAPLIFWSVASRVMWFFEVGQVEGYGDALDRSEEVALFLNDEAYEREKVVLVAHGFLNRYIFKELRKMGWYHAKDGGYDYLSVSVFVKFRDEAVNLQREPEDITGQKK